MIVASLNDIQYKIDVLTEEIKKKENETIKTTFCACTRDNRWISQKLSMEKNTIGNEPYIEKATVLGSFFVLIEDIKIVPVNKNINWSYFYYLTDKNVSRSELRLRTQSSRSARP